MAEVTDLTEQLPHICFEAMCIGCCKRWIAVTRDNAVLKDLECPGCGEVGKTVNTGQWMPE